MVLTGQVQKFGTYRSDWHVSGTQAGIDGAVYEMPRAMECTYMTCQGLLMAIEASNEAYDGNTTGTIGLVTYHELSGIWMDVTQETLAEALRRHYEPTN
ncbi:hypothetical protein N9937_00125 [bacterium]|nr:hypothetical protein [bacterium]